VFIAAGNESLSATNPQQWYVSASYGREKAKRYVDSKEDVPNAIARTGHRLSAVELTHIRLRSSWQRRFYKSLSQNRVSRFLPRGRQPWSGGRRREGRNSWPMPESQSRFLKQIIGPAERFGEEPKAFTSERQHAAQTFTLHVEWTDGRHTEGFAWAYYSG
jgi:hypothetical protein